MSSKSGAAGEILFFESEKRHEIQTLKMDTLTVSAFDAFIHVHDESNYYLSPICAEVILLYKVHIIDYHEVWFLELRVRGSEISLGQTLCVLKCFMTSIHRQSREELTFPFVETLLQSLWYITASGNNVLFYYQMSG